MFDLMNYDYDIRKTLGDIIGVKGRLQTKDINLQDDKKRKVLQVIAEKITLLSSY